MSFHLSTHSLSLSLQTSFLSDSQAQSSFSSLDMSLIPHFHAFHSLKPKFWGFLQNLGFFKIKEVFVKFLGWVLKI